MWWPSWEEHYDFFFAPINSVNLLNIEVYCSRFSFIKLFKRLKFAMRSKEKIHTKTVSFLFTSCAMQFQISVIACEMAAIMTLQKYQKVLRVACNLWVFDFAYFHLPIFLRNLFLWDRNLGTCEKLFPFSNTTMIN